MVSAICFTMGKRDCLTKQWLSVSEDEGPEAGYEWSPKAAVKRISVAAFPITHSCTCSLDLYVYFETQSYKGIKWTVTTVYTLFLCEPDEWDVLTGFYVISFCDVDIPCCYETVRAGDKEFLLYPWGPVWTGVSPYTCRTLLAYAMWLWGRLRNGERRRKRLQLYAAIVDDPCWCLG